MPALVRAGLSGWRGGLRFPNPLTAGCQTPIGSLFRVHWGSSSAAAANAALGISANTGWSVSNGAWTMSNNAVLSGLYVPFTLNLPGVSSGSPLTGVTVQNCTAATSYTGKPPWAPSVPYAAGDMVQPLAVTTGAWFQCTTAGTSAASEPSWPTSGTVSDNSAVWTFQGSYATWQPSASYALNAIVQPSPVTGAQFKCTTAGTSGASQPTWPTSGTVSDNSAVWTYNGSPDIFGLSIRHTSGAVIEDSTFGGFDASVNRVSYAATSVSGDDTGLLIQRCAMSNMRVGAFLTIGTLRDCYMAGFGYVPGDHTDGVSCLGTNGGTLSLLHNTILLNLNQTSPFDIGSTNSLCANITIDSNLIAGGGYGIYGGASGSFQSTSDEYFTVTNNRFSTMFFASGGSSGAAVDYNAPGVDPTNVWTGNYWYDGPSAGSLIAAP